ncbi:MAG TPA: Xaa-Pro peptidase family protein [Candidatus Omnitrophota bacterium]|nr:Xaa-Pro peptidase family protein [Candidatus Omnitrophota bacterium]HPS19986.1 Xaa-Pro peptidase family protein [Candidatus Omnitrophota bacterium]
MNDLCRNGILSRIKARIRSSDAIDGILLTHEADVMYAAGFFSGGALLLITGDAMPVFFIDTMNAPLAMAMLKNVMVRIVAGSASVKLPEILKRKKVKKLGINGAYATMSLEAVIKNARPAVDIVKCPPILENMRVQKSESEIRLIRHLARETVKIWNDVHTEMRPGMSEIALASLIDSMIRTRGYYNSFKTISAVGANTAYPHAVPTKKKLTDGAHGVFDFGIQFNGYCSDLTRVLVTGRISPKIKRLYDAVLFAHDNAIQKLEPGVKIGEVVRGVNKYFKDKGLGSYICHSLGHGVGLDIHEAPHLRESSEEVLREGMIVTIEPGLYAAGIGGIRIEDMILITAKGREVLTR